jgi:hypothetical protein
MPALLAPNFYKLVSTSSPVESCMISKRSLVGLMNEAGTGYLQQGFAIQCARKDCDSPILTKERLALKKLAADIARQGTTVEACLPYVSRNLLPHFFQLSTQWHGAFHHCRIRFGGG